MTTRTTPRSKPVSAALIWVGYGLGGFSLIGFAFHRIYTLLASFPAGSDAVSGLGGESTIFVAGAAVAVCVWSIGSWLNRRSRPVEADVGRKPSHPARAA